MDVAEVIAKAESGGYDAVPDVGAAEPASAVAETAAGGTAEKVAPVETGERTRAPDGKFAKADGAPAAPPVPGQKVAPAVAPAVGSAVPEPKIEAKAAVATGDIDPDDETTWKPEHRIPYDRFKTVMDKALAAEKRAAEYEERLKLATSVRDLFPPQPQQPAKGAAGQPDDDVLSEFFGQEPDPRYRQLEAKLQRLEQTLEGQQGEKLRADAERELDAKIGEVRARYPDVHEDDLWQAVALRGNKADLHAVAEQRQERINAYKAAGVREYLAQQRGAQSVPPVVGGAAVAPPAPPRPATASASSGSAGMVRNGFDLRTPDGRQAYAAAKYGD